MSTKTFTGVYAAMLSPRHRDDTIDTDAAARLVRFLVSKGVTQFALNGATGEFCLTAPEHLRTLLATVHAASEGRARVLCGVGAPGTTGTLALVRVAESAGAAGLLLPMPSFFPYQQEDLDAYCRDVATATSLPILLYNLPQFTSGLQPETVRRLIEDVPNIMGIKDSSGSLDILRDLTAHGIDACRIVGNDSALAPALAEGVCDGVVSGVACGLPELIIELYAQRTCQNSPRFEELLNLLTTYIAQLDRFPTPWGLKWTLQARGLIQASFSQPVTAHRREQAAALTQWLSARVPAVLPATEFPET